MINVNRFVKNILITSIALLALNGCTSVVHIYPPAASELSANKTAYITKSDLAKTSLKLDGPYSAFPIDIELGKALKTYAESYVGTVDIIDDSASSKNGVHVSLLNRE